MNKKYTDQEMGILLLSLKPEELKLLDTIAKTVAEKSKDTIDGHTEMAIPGIPLLPIIQRFGEDMVMHCLAEMITSYCDDSTVNVIKKSILRKEVTIMQILTFKEPCYWNYKYLVMYMHEREMIALSDITGDLVMMVRKVSCAKKPYVVEQLTFDANEHIRTKGFDDVDEAIKYALWCVGRLDISHEVYTTKEKVMLLQCNAEKILNAQQEK